MSDVTHDRSAGATDLRVLLVEDNDGDAMLVREALEDAAGDSVELRHVRTLADGTAVLTGDGWEPDAVFLDLGLPDLPPGRSALHEVLDVAPDVAVVVLTGLDDGDVAAAAVADGAQDYIVKSADPDGGTLLRAVRFARQRGDRLRSLQATNDELGAFAHTIAHDLRGPLAVLVGMARMVGSDDPNLDADTRADLARRIAGSAERLGRMVSGLLSFAESVGEGATDVVRLADVVEWVAGLAEGELDEADGRLAVADDLPAVLASEPALRSILLNLVSNSIKYRSPDRRLLVTIGAETTGDSVTVTVGDNGVGIRPGNRLKVFEVGERGRAPDVLERHTPGVGLGLSAVRRLVTQLGGTVWVADGDDGVGTRIRFTLSAARGPADGE